MRQSVESAKEVLTFSFQSHSKLGFLEHETQPIHKRELSKGGKGMHAVSIASSPERLNCSHWFLLELLCRERPNAVDDDPFPVGP